jgi:hypothetical protein
MSASPESTTNTFFDLSNPESRRREFRRLLIVAAVCWGASLVVGFVIPASQQIQEACTAEIEMVPEWRVWTAIAALLALVAVSAFGLYRLWHFKPDGAGYLAFSLFFPFFIFMPFSVVSSPFQFYVDAVSNLVMGMLLFAAWSNPGLFAAEARNNLDGDSGLTASHPSPIP